jgi:hypothetical protein
MPHIFYFSEYFNFTVRHAGTHSSRIELQGIYTRGAWYPCVGSKLGSGVCRLPGMLLCIFFLCIHRVCSVFVEALVYSSTLCIRYELVYSFYRRWRASECISCPSFSYPLLNPLIERPLILPIYLSARAFELASITSYANFCFLRHVRANAFDRSQNGSLRDGFAETCYRYSQNLPTVVLLLPRAALCLAALLSFSAATPAAVLATAGPSPRDRTFFDANGSLTSYARGLLITNAAWTMWRVFLLLCSW